MDKWIGRSGLMWPMAVTWCESDVRILFIYSCICWQMIPCRCDSCMGTSVHLRLFAWFAVLIGIIGMALIGTIGHCIFPDMQVASMWKLRGFSAGLLFPFVADEEIEIAARLQFAYQNVSKCRFFFCPNCIPVAQNEEDWVIEDHMLAAHKAHKNWKPQ